MSRPARSADAVLEAVRRWRGQVEAGGLGVGVSGGIDSIVLLHALVREGLRPHVVHVHHGLRAASDAEEAMVRAQCTALDVELTVVRAPKAPSTGRQAWARGVRHRAFADAARIHGLRWVAVAHHADDQLETQLLHLERGTGLAGLSGMPFSRPLSHAADSPLLTRPLLGVSRLEIAEAAQAWVLEWAEDASNRDTGYRRNAIRAEMAALSAADLEAFRLAGARVAQRVGAIRHYLGERLGSVHTLISADLEPWPAPVQELIVLEWLRVHDAGALRRRTLARAILDLLGSQPGRRVRLGSLEVWRDREGITVRPKRPGAPTQLHLERVELPAGPVEAKLTLLRQRVAASGGRAHAFVDADALAGPPALRARRAGDRFHPLGVQGSRKLKRYLTDRKVPSSAKQEVLVCTAGGEIVWVVGHQSDHRFRITDTTRDALILWVDESGHTVEDNAG